MNREQMAEELDMQIEGVLMSKGSATHADPLLKIAGELRFLPSRDFEQRILSDLMEQGGTEQGEREPRVAGAPQAAHILFGCGAAMPAFSLGRYSAMPADPRSLLLSFMSHAAVVALIASGIWLGHATVVRPKSLSADLTFIPLPPGERAPRGGGSGGDRSPVHASRGTPPKFSDTQLAPPAIIVRSEAKLRVGPTVLGPPDLKLPQSNQLGDLTSLNTVMPSNGTGAHGGIGENYGTGDGGGKGPGVGPGSGGSFGGGTYRPGNGVSAPRAVYDPDPEYSEEARQAKFQGNVVLSVIVDPTGRVRDIRVVRSVGLGLDEKATDAVEKWRFTPGMRDGHAVAVQVNVEVNFRLY